MKLFRGPKEEKRIADMMACDNYTKQFDWLISTIIL